MTDVVQARSLSVQGEKAGRAVKALEKRRIFSCDGHIQEAPDLWRRRLPSAFVDRAPFIEQGQNGEDVLWLDGKPRGLAGLPQAAMQRPGLYDVVARAEDLESQGIEKEVLYPQWSMFLLSVEDPAFEAALLRAYNDWLAETVAVVPERFLGVGILPVHDVEQALEELEHVISLGLSGVTIPQFRRELRYNDEKFEPLWSSIEASGLPLSIHGGISLEHRGPGAVGANVTRNLSSFRNTFPLFVFSGVLDRHPGLRMVLTEGGIGWLPSTLQDMDGLNENGVYDTGPTLSVSPSELWRRQCFATFIDDRAGLRLLDLIGYETVLFGADYPHPEGLFPSTQEVVGAQFRDLPEHVTEAILYGNAERLWLKGE